MRNRFGLCAAAMVAVCLAGGCASSSHGTKIDNDKVSQIQKGSTTKEEVVQMFGPPMHSSLMGDGRRMMMYHYTESKQQVKGQSFIPVAGAFMGGSKGTIRQQQLQIVLNKDNVVEDFELNDGTNNVETNTGFGRASTTSSPARAASSR